MNARQLKAKLNDIDERKIPIITDFNKQTYLISNGWISTNTSNVMTNVNGLVLYKKPLEYDDIDKSKKSTWMVATMEEAIIYEMKKELYKKYLNDQGKSTFKWYDVKINIISTDTQSEKKPEKKVEEKTDDGDTLDDKILLV